MNKFAVNICPLCGKSLKYRLVSKVGVYECPTPFDWTIPGGIARNGTSHYEVEIDDYMSVQHMYIIPYIVENVLPIVYSIDNFGHGKNSRIYKMSYNENGISSWKFVVETPFIKEDSEENLSNRIKTLLTFL